MNIQHDKPAASISIVQWTTERKGLRITLNEPTLKRLGWTKRTKVSIAYYKSYVHLKEVPYGNSLHQRGHGPSLSLISMTFPSALKDKNASQIVTPIFEHDHVRVNIPREFFAAAS